LMSSGKFKNCAAKTACFHAIFNSDKPGIIFKYFM
jgi:hypothetical protein